MPRGDGRREGDPRGRLVATIESRTEYCLLDGVLRRPTADAAAPPLGVNGPPGPATDEPPADDAPDTDEAVEAPPVDATVAEPL